MTLRVDFMRMRRAGKYGGVVLLPVVSADGKPVVGMSVACMLVAGVDGVVVPVPVHEVLKG